MKANRIAVGSIFFIHGLCFSSWASRIPTIQRELNLSEATLGAVLFALPFGFFVSLLFSGWLISRAGSKRVVVCAGMLYSAALVAIGFAPRVELLVAALFSFGFFGNLLNISINTQAVAVEAQANKKLMASFHGMWSLAGFVGAALGTWMIGQHVIPEYHFALVFMVGLVTGTLIVKYLIKNDVRTEAKQPIFALPDKSILSLGIIAFCSMMAEGAMFDWSGVYFKKVVKVEEHLIGIGYTTFMVAMAGTRFIADTLSAKFGLKKMLQASGALSVAGLSLAVFFPSFWTALLGFFMVGIGVSSVVPLVYSAVGKSKKLSPSMALTAVSSFGFLGFLLGPPIIGFVAEQTNLRAALIIIIFMAFAVFVLASLKGEEHSATLPISNDSNAVEGQSIHVSMKCTVRCEQAS